VIGQLADLLGRTRSGSRSSDPVLELDAGTGVLTGQLTRSGVDVVAVEAVADRRAQLRRALPQVPVLAARAGCLPVAPRSVAAILVAGTALLAEADVVGEIERVLRPDGLVILVWRPAAGSAAPELRGFGAPRSTEHAADVVAGSVPASASVVTSWRRA
jgi:hypothetical protein